MASRFIEGAILFALPFAVWLAWAAWARRTGRPMGSTPWAWLVASGAALVGAALFVSALVEPDNRDAVYVPAQVAPDGSVTRGRFEPRR